MANSRVIFAMIFLMSCMCFFLFVVQTTFKPLCISCFKRGSMVLQTSEENNRTFLLLPDARCKQKHPFLVILVTTTHEQLDARSAIRQTWGKDQMIGDKRIAVFFRLGTMAEQNTNAEANIAAESLVYRDIIQKNFTDTYYNLTLKTVMGLEWVHHFCPQSNFVMKTDTDVFVNVFYLTELLEKKNKMTRLFTGALMLHKLPIRSRSSRWYASEEEFPGEMYPPFCSGTGYVFSADVAHDVFNISGNVPFFKLEDVFVGLCLQKLEMAPEPLHTEETFVAFKNEVSICTLRKLVTCHPFQPNELLLYWNDLERTVDEKC